MSFVIIHHVSSAQLMYGVANLYEYLDTVPKRFFFQPVDNSFSVNNFFVLSGSLSSCLNVKEIEHRKGKFPLFCAFYVHHLLRLSPAYYVILFFYFFKLLPYIGSGPQWYVVTIAVKNIGGLVYYTLTISIQLNFIINAIVHPGIWQMICSFCHLPNISVAAISLLKVRACHNHW